MPVFCAYFHYPERIMGLGVLMRTTEDAEADMARLRQWYVPYIGKNRGTV